MDKLVARLVSDMEEDTGKKRDPEAPHKLWLDAAKTEEGGYRPDYHQVISPYIHEDFGTEAVNLRLQKEARGESLKRVGAISGITLFDKVIQTRNRGASDPLRAWNFKTKANEPCEVFNGELGYVRPHGFDKNWKWEGFRLKHFWVTFSRKEHLAVGYGKKLTWSSRMPSRFTNPKAVSSSASTLWCRARRPRCCHLNFFTRALPAPLGIALCSLSRIFRRY